MIGEGTSLRGIAGGQHRCPRYARLHGLGLPHVLALELAQRLDELWMTTVTVGEWGVSFETCSAWPGVKLNVYAFPDGLAHPSIHCSECDGIVFTNKVMAHAWAIEHGHLRPWFPASYSETWRAYGTSWHVARQVKRLREMRR